MKAKTKSRPKALPKFKSENQERAFWATHSPLDYFDVGTAKVVTLPNLRPTMRTISIRLPEDMIERLKIMAHRRDVPYQSLAKLFLAKQLKSESASLDQAA